MNSSQGSLGEPLRLFYFTQLFYPLVYGGGESLFLNLAREFAKRGHEVHVVAQRLHGSKSFEVHQGINIHRVAPEITSSGTLPLTLSSNLGYVSQATQMGFRLISQTRKERKMREIIHSNTYSPALSGHLCAWSLGIPDIVTFHDVYQTSGKEFWSNWMSRLGRRTPFYAPFSAMLIERLLLRLKASAFHTVSEASRDDLIQGGVSLERIRVIPNGLDDSGYEIQGSGYANESESQHVAVFIGRMVFYKNIETIIRAFQIVVKEVPDAKLILVGDGPERKKLEKLAEPLHGTVEFVGRVSDERKARILLRSSYMVFPSLVEGFGIVLIEAFACKKPALVSSVRPMSDIVTDDYDGFVLPPFDHLVWAGKMIELFLDEGRTKRMGENASRTFVSKYRLTHVVDEMEKLYVAVQRG